MDHTIENPFSDLILFNNQKKIIINYFVDNYFSPIYLPNLSKVLIKLIKKILLALIILVVLIILVSMNLRFS